MTELFKALEQAAADSQYPLEEILAALRFDQNGLLPAIAQDVHSGEVLMLAWMNIEALRSTLETGRVTYYSRSRKELWRKGDTSGHFQHLKRLRLDCDGDAVLMAVEQVGAACHTHRRSCFYIELNNDRASIVDEPGAGV